MMSQSTLKIFDLVRNQSERFYVYSTSIIVSLDINEFAKADGIT